MASDDWVFGRSGGDGDFDGWVEAGEVSEAGSDEGARCMVSWRTLSVYLGGLTSSLSKNRPSRNNGIPDVCTGE